MRFIQLRIEQDNTLTKTEADEIFGKLLHNFGHAGEAYAQYLVQNIDSVTNTLKNMQLKIDKEMNLSGKERFFSATLAAVFTGAYIAQRLGLHDIDIPRVYKAIAKELAKMRTDLVDRNFDGLSTLADYISTNIRDILVINGAVDGRSGMAQPAPIVKPTTSIKARLEPDTELLFIPVSELRAYCDKIKVPQLDFTKALKNAGVLREASEKKNLTKGMDITAPPVRCLWISTHGISELSVDTITSNLNSQQAAWYILEKKAKGYATVLTSGGLMTQAASVLYWCYGTISSIYAGLKNANIGLLVLPSVVKMDIGLWVNTLRG